MSKAEDVRFEDNEICSHKSVGIIVYKGVDILLVERKKFPFGFAPPAGHVDENEYFFEAAVRELKEETGLEAIELIFLIEGMKDKNSCSAKNGTGHYWKIYLAVNYQGELKENIEETKSLKWHSLTELHKLAFRTCDYLQGKITEEGWEKSPGLEVVWYEWLQDLDILDW